jgi:hypothetical protein
MASIDCTEAFPSVSDPVLLDKLRRHKTPPWIHNIITSFLENRKASFRVINAHQNPSTWVFQREQFYHLYYSIFTRRISLKPSFCSCVCRWHSSIQFPFQSKHCSAENIKYLNMPDILSYAPFSLDWKWLWRSGILNRWIFLFLQKKKKWINITS